MTDKSIFKAVVLAFFVTFTIASIFFLIAGLRRILFVGTAGTLAVTGGASYSFVRLPFMGTVGVVVVTYLVLIWLKRKK
jgi:uncharacterized protein with PQ loop repeat